MHVNYSGLTSDVHLPVGVKLRIGCTSVNNGSSMLHFGDSPESETCFTGFYHYADDGASNDIYRCANNQSTEIVHDDRAVLARVRRGG